MIKDMPSENVVIIGSGIVGIACAHYLSKAGLSITVIDKKGIAQGCSHANCGYISPSHVLPLTEPGAIKIALKSLLNPNSPFRVKPRLNFSFWHWMWQFAKRCNHSQMLESGKHLKSILDSSMTEYRKLIQEEQLECEWKENGLLFVFQSQTGLNKYAQTDRILSDNFDLSARLIKGEDLPAFDPALKHGLAGAFHYKDDASVRPDLLNSQWSDRLRESGVRFLTDCEMQSITRSNGRVIHLNTTRGEMKADHFIFATGAWSSRLSKELQCLIPIEPGKGYSITMSKPEPCPIYPMLFPEHKVGVSPFHNGYRLGSMMEFCGFDSSIPERRIKLLRDSAKHYLVAPYTDAVQETWYGWRPMTWDSLPVIGPVPGLDNSYLATGHNMLGMSLAAATGKLITEMVRGTQTHIDARPYSPQRFH